MFTQLMQELKRKQLQGELLSETFNRILNLPKEQQLPIAVIISNEKLQHKAVILEHHIYEE